MRALTSDPEAMGQIAPPAPSAALLKFLNLFLIFWMNVLVFCHCHKQELVSYLERELFWAHNVKLLYEGFVNFWLLIVLVSYKPVSYKQKNI